MKRVGVGVGVGVRVQFSGKLSCPLYDSDSQLKPLPQKTSASPRLCGKTNAQILSLRPLRLCGELFSRSWVRLVVDAGEVLEIEVGVDLCGAQVGMPQQFLYGAQVFG